MREWLSQTYQGSKAGDLWTDLWNQASGTDFRPAVANNDQEMLGMLASEDGLGIKLRRIASHLYEARTGDHHGAAKILGVAPQER